MPALLMSRCTAPWASATSRARSRMRALLPTSATCVVSVWRRPDLPSSSSSRARPWWSRSTSARWQPFSQSPRARARPIPLAAPVTAATLPLSWRIPLRCMGATLRGGSVAVVTGAASGIGRALALGLWEKGCHLALVDLDHHGLARLELELGRSGRRQTLTTHVADVGNRARMRDLAREVADAHGAVHLLINNAGIGYEAAFPQTSLDDWDRIIDVNLWGVIYGCHFFMPHLAKVSRGHIVNMSSLLGIVAMAGQTAYSTTKFAVRGFSESLAEELRATTVGLT